MQNSTGKSLSNGTLSLRFMQNALRSKQQAAVELERAKVKDDAEWEVSKEIREAWGLQSDTRGQVENRIHCETSYLPFIFSSGREADESSEEEDHVKSEPSSPEFVKPSGRRTFDDGREVIAIYPDPTEEEKPSEITIPPKAERSARSEKEPRSGKFSRIGRPGILTTTKGGRNVQIDLMSQLNPRPKEMPSVTRFQNMANGTPVLQMISEQTTDAVGTDLRASRVSKDSRAKVSGGDSTKNSMNFLRPAGVDGPVVSGSKPAKRSRVDSISEEGGHAVRHPDNDSPDQKLDRKQGKKKKKQKKALSDD